MNEIKLDEIKSIEVNILKEFKTICDAEGYNYSIFAGTLLGAVRHKGFIPWDDDIDVMMPRPDYIKFKDYCLNNQTGFQLYCNETNPKYGYLFAKISNPKTIVYEENTDRYNLGIGISIDVFVYDGMGKTKKEAIKRYNRSALYRELLIAGNWERFFRSKTHKFYYEPFRLILFLFSRLVNPKKLIRKINMMYNCNSFYNCEYVGNLGSDKRSKSIIKRKNFDKYVELEFEGEFYKAFMGYKDYLTRMFGDYMKLPPLNKRVTHHSFKAYWK